MSVLSALVDGMPGAALAIDNRGLAYGDGIFETIRFVAGTAPLWRRHQQRLARGARRLQLAAPSAQIWLTEAQALADGDDCLIKLILLRGGARGYAAAADAGSHRIVLRLPLPETDPRIYTDGARLRLCRTRLAIQPVLAGIKHLNRLEQVLARSEWRDPGIHEGLMLDTNGHVVCATAANLFVVREGHLLTPLLDRCGVAGVARATLIVAARRWLSVCETRLRVDDLAGADELFLSNSVRGVMPIRALAKQRWRPGPVTRRLGYTLAALGIGPVITGQA